MCAISPALPRTAANRISASSRAVVSRRSWVKPAPTGSSTTGTPARLADLHGIAQRIAQQYGCVAAISGETDYVSNGSRTAKLNNGTPLFPKVTASGCLLSTIAGAFAAVAAPEDYLHAVAEACTVYAVAGELAAQGLQPAQSGSFAWKLIDSLAAISAQEVAARAKVEWI